MKKNAINLLLSSLLVLCMVLGLTGTAMAESPSNNSTSFTKVERTKDCSLFKQDESEDVLTEQDSLLNSTTPVRVFIVMDDFAVIDKGFSTKNIAENAEAMALSRKIIEEQEEMSSKISRVALEGKKLDVRYNYTLLTNAIAAEVPANTIPTIKNMPEIKDVYIVRQYILDKDVEEQPSFFKNEEQSSFFENEEQPSFLRNEELPLSKEESLKIYEGKKFYPAMYSATEQVNAKNTWSYGYTGVGELIAVIDSGIAVGHPSFDETAFKYSLKQAHAEKGTIFSYMGLKTIGKSDVDAIWEKTDLVTGRRLLHAPSFISPANKDDVYVSLKIPYAVNYVDQNLDVTHENDEEGDHGTHVSGIALANKYICVTPNTVSPNELDPYDYGTAEFEEQEDGVCGIAYNAQLVSMKVFGSNGGGFEDDIFAAIEDAIVIGCDAINLSVSSYEAGNATPSNEYFYSVMEKLEDTDTVLVASAGNSGKWYEYTLYGFLEIGNPKDNPNNQTLGEPASYTNSFAVASADNISTMCKFVRFPNNASDLSFSKKIQYEDTSSNFEYEEGCTLPAFDTLDTLGTGKEYDYVLIDANGKARDYEGIDCAGKIVMVNIFQNDFYEKMENAAENDAAGLIIYYGSSAGELVPLDLSGAEYPIPTISMGPDVYDFVKETGTKHVVDAGVNAGTEYYTGKLLITANSDERVYSSDRAGSKISDYSSFGATQNLEMKPEITAPGAYINSTTYSEEGFSYGLMSGTSMAAPNISGQVALVSGYIKANLLNENTGLSIRQLSMALLMSTATPLYFDSENEIEYLTRAQGAGLSDVLAATRTPILVQVEGRNDGKVKAELGDDPERNGVYRIEFSLMNMGLDINTHYYEIDTSLLTEELSDANGLSEEPIFIKGEPCKLGHTVSFSAEFADDHTPAISGNEIIVKPSVSTNVIVEMKLNAESKRYMENFPAGEYVEGYVYLNNCDPVLVPSECPNLVIPMLAYYGGFGESSMVDPYCSREKVASIPYYFLVANQGIPNSIYINRCDEATPIRYEVNPYISDTQELPGREALQSNDIIDSYVTTYIRNAKRVYTRISDADTGEIFFIREHGAREAAYYDSEKYENVRTRLGIGWNMTDMSGKKLANGRRVKLEIVSIPEYYDGLELEDITKDEYPGLVREDIFTIDDIAPEILDVRVQGNTVKIKVHDDHYVAAVEMLDAYQADVLYYDDGDTWEKLVKAVDQTEEGAITEITMKIPQEVVTIVVTDYAGNEAAYLVNNSPESDTFIIEGLTILPSREGDCAGLFIGDTEKASVYMFPTTLVERRIAWTSSNRNVATVDEDGTITGVGPGVAIIKATSYAMNREREHISDSIVVVVYDCDYFTFNAFVDDGDATSTMVSMDTRTLPAYNVEREIDSAKILDAEYFEGGIISYTDGEAIYLTTESFASSTKIFEGEEGIRRFAYSNESKLAYILDVDEDGDSYTMSVYETVSGNKITDRWMTNAVAITYAYSLDDCDIIFVMNSDGYIDKYEYYWDEELFSLDNWTLSNIRCNSIEGGSIHYDYLTGMIIAAVSYEDDISIYLIDPVSGATKEYARYEGSLKDINGIYINESQEIALKDIIRTVSPDPEPVFNDPAPNEQIVIAPTTGGTEVPSQEEETENGYKVKEMPFNDKNSSAYGSVVVMESPEGEKLGLATITMKGEKNGKNIETTISRELAKSILNKAGTEDVMISLIVTDENGVKTYGIFALAQYILSGEPLYILSINEFRTDEDNEVNFNLGLVNANSYKPDNKGNITLDLPRKGEYMLVSKERYDEQVEEIKETIKPKKSSMTVKKGKKTTLVLDKNVDMSNIKSITYSTKNTDIISLTKSGKMTAKKAGTAKVTIKVVLVNGDTKTLTRTIKVK